MIHVWNKTKYDLEFWEVKFLINFCLTLIILFQTKLFTCKYYIYKKEKKDLALDNPQGLIHK